jgi:hypothetical protein
MLSVQLMNNSSPVEKIGKTLSAGNTYSCALKDDTSVLDPVIIIQTSDNIYTYNYMYISDFGRYYFINDIVSLNNNRWMIKAHVDVLETYKSSILANEAVIRRQDKLFNLYLDDSDFHVLNYERVQTLKFPANAFSKNLTYVLVVNNDRYW